jgi:ketosteroid isomerase-like protein
MKADPRTEAEVRAALGRFTDSYAKKDMEGMLACVAPDPDVVLFGTGADEKRIGLAEIQLQAERDWAQTEAISMNFDWMSISAAGPVAWAAVKGAFQIRAGGQEFRMPARGSFVLEKRGDKWLVVHSHFSTPAAGQEEGESIPA